MVVDDDARVRSLIRRSLEPEGFEVDEAADESELEARLIACDYDLITLDLNLPGTDGLEITRRLRRRTDTPIIMVTGKGDVIDRIVGLEVGADDYVAKPFHVRELLARVRTVLRRVSLRASSSASDSLGGEEEMGYVVAGLKLVPSARLLLDAEGEPIALTRGEFDILAALIRANGRALSREALIDARGDDADAFDRAIDSTIARLRKKLPPGTISTVREVGYRIAFPVRLITMAT
ncbi:response regulator [Acuticoccus mangrovi]|uniref:Response regulator transcription factor n=1 Tax=Acuticoccus mangrovi TaxID=2796142 RepID=A0A934IHK3_9HYPH|nr:response regulator transcription factor [Acuticoccus mangrovi]MBJ3776598.1 response regulator transcription factor [Acuticoccus mangrovi]